MRGQKNQTKDIESLRKEDKYEETKDKTREIEPLKKEGKCEEAKDKSREIESIRKEGKCKEAKDKSREIESVRKEGKSEEAKDKSKEIESVRKESKFEEATDKSRERESVRKEGTSEEAKDKSRERESVRKECTSEEAKDKSRERESVRKDGKSEEAKDKSRERESIRKEGKSEEAKDKSRERESLRKEDKSEEAKDKSKEIEPVRKEKKYEEPKSSSEEDHSNQVKPQFPRSLGEDCNKETPKEGRSDVDIVLNEDKSKLSSEKDNCERKIEDTALASCNKKSEKAVLESSLKVQKVSDDSTGHCSKTAVIEKDSLHDSELQHSRKTENSSEVTADDSKKMSDIPTVSDDKVSEGKNDSLNDDDCQSVKETSTNCSTKAVLGKKVVSKKTRSVVMECGEELDKRVCKSDTDERKDGQNMVENKAASVEKCGEKLSDLKDIEIPKLDQPDKKLNDNICSDEKIKVASNAESIDSCKKSTSSPCSDKKPKMCDGENATLKEKEPSKNALQTKHSSPQNDNVTQKISETNCKDKILGDESDKKMDAAKSKQGSDDENSVKKPSKSIDPIKNGGLPKKDQKVNDVDRRFEDDTGSVKNETVSDKENSTLFIKEAELEAKAAVKSKLRRSSRTSRGCIESNKSELEHSELCKNELGKSKVSSNEQKSKVGCSEQKSNETDSNCQKCPEVDADVLNVETDKNLAEKTVCNVDLTDKDCDKSICKIEILEKNDCENKRKKSETKGSKSSARRSRNLRKSVRNVPKSDIPSEKFVASTMGHKSISNSEVTASPPILPVVHAQSTEKLDKFEVKFTPLTKDSTISCASEVHFCGMYISSVCFETKTKYKTDMEVVNNKALKNRIKENFSKSLSKCIISENAGSIDQEESFSVGRIQTRGNFFVAKDHYMIISHFMIGRLSLKKLCQCSLQNV